MKTAPGILRAQRSTRGRPRPRTGGGGSGKTAPRRPGRRTGRRGSRGVPRRGSPPSRPSPASPPPPFRRGWGTGAYRGGPFPQGSGPGREPCSSTPGETSRSGARKEDLRPGGPPGRDTPPSGRERTPGRKTSPSPGSGTAFRCKKPRRCSSRAGRDSKRPGSRAIAPIRPRGLPLPSRPFQVGGDAFLHIWKKFLLRPEKGPDFFEVLPTDLPAVEVFDDHQRLADEPGVVDVVAGSEIFPLHFSERQAARPALP